MKKMLMVPILLCLSMATYAQRPSNPGAALPAFLQQEKTINGFTVRLIHAAGGGYGYDILQENKLLIHQFHSPLGGGSIQTKEDAFKVAEWVISEHQSRGNWNTLVPPHIARQLNIETHSLTRKQAL